MRHLNLNGFFAKGLMIVSGLAVFALALVGSFYLLLAGVVIALSTTLFSMAFSIGKGKPEPVRVRTHQSSYRQPLDAEYRVIRRK